MTAKENARRKRRMVAMLNSADFSDAIREELKVMLGVANLSDDAGSVTDTDSTSDRESSAPPEGFVASDPSAQIGNTIAEETKDKVGVNNPCDNTGSCCAALNRESSAPLENFSAFGPSAFRLRLCSCLDVLLINL